MNQEERNEMIEEYGRGFDLFSAALHELPSEAWQFKTAPGEWSVREVIIHMADSESIGATRARMLIAQPGSTLMPYDDAKWAQALHYEKQRAEDALQIFRLVRQATYDVIRAADERAYSHEVIMPEKVHPEYGDAYTLDKWLGIYTGHVRDHVEQLQKIHLAWINQAK